MEQANNHNVGVAGCGFACVLSAFSFFLAVGAAAQGVLSLDSCLVMALRNNKQLAIAQLKQVWHVMCARLRARNTCRT